jgi:hypothetical protein
MWILCSTHRLTLFDKAVADYAYDKKFEDGSYAQPPPELVIGMDWLNFGTPPRAGGLYDQPLCLMRRIRRAIQVYNNVKSWRMASRLKAEAFNAWQSANSNVVRFMEYIWSLNDDNG